MSSLWDILGLDGPTQDVKAIKRAYAKKLKTTRPDEDPEGFMALRGALEQAQHHTRWAAQQSVARDFDDLPDLPPSDSSNAIQVDSTVASPRPSVFGAPEPTPVPQTPHEIAAEVMDDVQALMKEGWRRTKKSEWRKIIDDERITGLETSMEFEYLLAEYFGVFFGHTDKNQSRNNARQKPPIISQTVGQYIFDVLGWNMVENYPEWMQIRLKILRADFRLMPPRRTVQHQITKAGPRPRPQPQESQGVPWWGIIMIVFFLLQFVRLMAGG